MAAITNRNGTWRAQLGPKFNRIAKSFPTKAAATQWAREIEHGSGSNANVKLAELIKAYRKNREDSCRPVLERSNEDYMLCHLTDDLGAQVVMDLDTPKLLKWAQTRTKNGAGPVALNMELSKLGTVLRHTASLMNLRIHDVVDLARPTLQHYGLVSYSNTRNRRPTPDELARICRWFRERPQFAAPMEDIINVLRQSILRRGEVFRIEWKDLVPASRSVIVRDRKHPRRRVGNDEMVLLNGDAWEIVQRQPRVADVIFPYSPLTASKMFKTACDELGISDLHLHDLKREATSSLAEIGLTPQEIAAAGGPKKWQVQQRYTDIDASKLNEKVVRLRAVT